MYQFTPLALKTITKTQNWYVWYVWYVPGPELFWPSMPSPLLLPWSSYPRYPPDAPDTVKLSLPVRAWPPCMHRSAVSRNGLYNWSVGVVFFVSAGSVSLLRGFWAKFGRTFGRKPGSKVVCAAISGGLCAMPECPSLLRAQRQDVLQIRQSYAQCPRRPSLLTCLQWVDVLQRLRAAYTQCPKVQRKRL